MTRITEDNVLQESVHRFTGFASDLGLRPGEWPEKIQTNMGNGLPFIRRDPSKGWRGDYEWVNYIQANGCLILRIFND